MICSKSSVETRVRLGSFCRHTGMFDRLKKFLCFAPSGWSYTMISYSLNLVCLRRSIPMWNTSVSGENTSFLVANEWVQCNQILMSAFSAEHVSRGVASNEAEEAVASSLFCARTRARIGRHIKLEHACAK